MFYNLNTECNGGKCKWNEENFYYVTMYVLLTLFFIAMTILVTNLLVGLAVGDIEAVRAGAAFERKKNKIDLALGSVIYIFNVKF